MSTGSVGGPNMMHTFTAAFTDAVKFQTTGKYTQAAQNSPAQKSTGGRMDAITKWTGMMTGKIIGEICSRFSPSKEKIDSKIQMKLASIGGGHIQVATGSKKESAVVLKTVKDAGAKIAYCQSRNINFKMDLAGVKTSDTLKEAFQDLNTQYTTAREKEAQVMREVLSTMSVCSAPPTQATPQTPPTNTASAKIHAKFLNSADELKNVDPTQATGVQRLGKQGAAGTYIMQVGDKKVLFKAIQLGSKTTALERQERAGINKPITRILDNNEAKGIGKVLCDDMLKDLEEIKNKLPQDQYESLKDNIQELKASLEPGAQAFNPQNWIPVKRLNNSMADLRSDEKVASFLDKYGQLAGVLSPAFTYVMMSHAQERSLEKNDGIDMEQLAKIRQLNPNVLRDLGAIACSERQQHLTDGVMDQNFGNIMFDDKGKPVCIDPGFSEGGTERAPLEVFSEIAQKLYPDNKKMRAAAFDQLCEGYNQKADSENKLDKSAISKARSNLS